MRVVIVGGGNVGFTSAEVLCRFHDVLVIEKDSAKADNIRSMLNVSVLMEDGSNPKVLRSAIDRIDAEVILSALSDDSLNLFIAMVATRYKPGIKTVATLRDPDYSIETAAEGFEGIDVIISPEQIMADKIVRIASLENVIQYDYIESRDAALAIFKVYRDHDIVGKVVMDLDIPADCSVVAVYRGDATLLDAETVQVRAGDRICMFGSPAAMEGFNRLMGLGRESKEFVIIGASASGINIARSLLQPGKRRFIKIIDRSEENCRRAAAALSDAVVVHADIVDPQVIRGENLDRADVIITVSSSDERNLLACMAGLRFGVRKIISRYSTGEYEEIFKHTGVDSVLGYHRVIANEVVKNLIYDENAILRLDREGELFFSIGVDRRSRMADRCLGDLHLPAGMRIAAAVRDGIIIYPRLNTAFREGDEVLVFSHDLDRTKLARLTGRDAPAEL